MFQTYFGHVSDICLSCFGKVSDMFLTCSGHASDMLRTCFGHVLIRFLDKLITVLYCFNRLCSEVRNGLLRDQLAP